MQTITPKHLGLATAAIILAIVGVPYIASKYNAAYPEYGSWQRVAIDKCVRLGSNRWSEKDVAMCLASEGLRRRYR